MRFAVIALVDGREAVVPLEGYKFGLASPDGFFKASVEMAAVRSEVAAAPAAAAEWMKLLRVIFLGIYLPPIPGTLTRSNKLRQTVFPIRKMVRAREPDYS